MSKRKIPCPSMIRLVVEGNGTRNACSAAILIGCALPAGHSIASHSATPETRDGKDVLLTWFDKPVALASANNPEEIVE